MGFRFQRAFRGPFRTRINLTGSGVSLTKRFGRRVTVNSRPSVSVRLFRGLSWRSR